MAWVRIDDQAPRHDKMLKAGPAACWLWVCGIAHSQSQLTDGFISLEALPMIGVKGESRARRLAETLVESGLFDRAEGGYRVHDYHGHNDTKEEAVTRRQALSVTRATAGRAGGLASAEARKQNASKPLEANPSPTPTRPDPTRPIPTFGRQRPLMKLSRFAVFRWQIEQLMAIVGAEFGPLDEWLCELNAKAEAAAVVIPNEWEFIRAETVAEAQRRGLPVATRPQAGKQTSALAAAVANIAREAL